ncbi:MAG: hypothetical protein JWM74_6188 [Myxococcaceae bacterium]|nr:hypothetical protein [Myxococcaceae bacterium]
MRRLGAALLAIGLAGGALSDPSGEAVARPVVMRGGYRVLEADFHAHTTFSDGGLSPFDLVVMAERRHLDVLAVTEHNAVFPAKMARAFSRAVGGPVIVVGEEVTTSRYHLIALGLEDAVVARQPPADVVDEIHARGGFVIAAHPVKHFQSALLPLRDRLDGAEVMHPLAFADRGGDWRWTDMRAFYMDQAGSPAPDHVLTAIGSSDYHWASVLGLVRTWVFIDPNARLDEHAVLDALRAHATVVRGPGGELFGDPELVRVLRAEPMPPHAEPDDYGYRGRSTFDRVTRALGWLGLLMLVLLRKRAEREVATVVSPSGLPARQ